MQPDEVDEVDLFRKIETSGTRALLIGRRAMVLLGLPVMTADYDLWVHGDDVEVLNAAVASLGLAPNRPPDEARKVGRYVLENGEHVDVMLARELRSHLVQITFDACWSRRVIFDLEGAHVAVPSIQDLIATKRFAGRPKDMEDIRMLTVLAQDDSP